ncbi:urate hydroxylase PuuD [Rubellimicrobium aerolatum]|uniref:Urate hydroxylase PuuD n=1 Tax=Rubellimicrobium aerolatum TaxID=490979 RepID=A0ABW0S9L2_9RHOB|nr:urate hydroxylase PuuD [Rubellimicrobium aerolatum]MBP1805003.1 putative membrane protein [Rubellimicrobium aerolatum]
MYDAAVLWHWAEFAVRWLHVITAIAWIGSSFYFIALDLGLHRDRKLSTGADGEEWQVHGGGFYNVQKYLVAPAQLPNDLVWFKWESYSTWLSGFTLLILVYWLGGELYLIDPRVQAFPPLHLGRIEIPSGVQAAALSAASLALGWVIYDRLCRSRFGQEPVRLMVALFGVIVGMSLFYTNVFSGRAALLHLGAFTATIMSGNVFFTIMPNQRIVVADLKAGRKPDPKYGKIAKQRSTHNNYLTLPVIFLMLSNHYPLAFAGANTWAIASLVFLMGVTIRHWFNTTHARQGRPHWTWAATAVIFLLIVWLASPRAFGYSEAQEAEATLLAPGADRYAQASDFAEVHSIVRGRCSMCHAAEPAWPGLHWPPKGVMLETEAQVANRARDIYLQSGASHAMPPGNLSEITEEERAAIRAWYQGAT